MWPPDMEKRALWLKAKRNARAEISKLPGEILGNIFALLSRSSPLSSWYALNLVCRHWRGTALGTVALWTNLPTGHHNLALIMLERSKLADLHVEFDKGTPPEVAANILIHIGRIRSLAFNGCIAPAIGTLDYLKNCSPHLGRLTITLDYVPFPNFSTPATESISLRHFDWEVLAFPALTHLTLVNVILPQQVTIQHFLSTLRDMPNLEEIKIHSNAVSNRDAPPIATHPTVEFPFLRSIDVEWDTTHHHVMYLLSHLRLPRLNHLGINCISRMEAINASKYSSFLRVVLPLISRADFGTLENLCTCSDQWFDITLPGDLWPLSRGARIWFVDYDGFDDGAESFSYEVVATFDDYIVSNIVRLHIADDYLTESEILQLLSRFNNVEYIAGEEKLVATLAKVLYLTHGASPCTSFSVLPRLTGISIPTRRMDYDFRAIKDFFDALKTRHQGGRSRWARGLTPARHRLGAPIKKLYLDLADLSEDSVFFSLGDIGVEICNRPSVGFDGV